MGMGMGRTGERTRVERPIYEALVGASRRLYDYVLWLEDRLKRLEDERVYSGVPAVAPRDRTIRPRYRRHTDADGIASDVETAQRAAVAEVRRRWARRGDGIDALEF